MLFEIKVNPITLKAEIDCSKNIIYIVKDGRVVTVEPPKSGYGEQVAVWLGGKVDRIETKSSTKV